MKSIVERIGFFMGGTVISKGWEVLKGKGL